MDLRTAIGDFAEMLAMGAGALGRFVDRELPGFKGSSVDTLLAETQSIASRLRGIADELAQSDVTKSAGADD